jgi:hypothetical protein
LFVLIPRSGFFSSQYAGHGRDQSTKFALRAQEKAARDQRERDREIEQQALVGTLRAIEAELTVHKRALEHLSDRVKKAARSH